MKCELIISGLQDKQTFFNHCYQSVLCKRWHDGTLHAYYHTKRYAREDADALKKRFSNIMTTIGTDFDSWAMLG